MCTMAVSDVGPAYACKPCLDKASKTKANKKLTFYDSATGWGNFRGRLELDTVTMTGN